MPNISKHGNNPIEGREISACTQVLAGLRYSNELIVKVFGRVDIMRESVIYQGILQEGIEKGRQEGELSLMLKILTNRWGQLPGDLVANLNSLSIEQIEELSRVVFDLKDRQALADWLEHRAKRP